MKKENLDGQYCIDYVKRIGTNKDKVAAYVRGRCIHIPLQEYLNNKDDPEWGYVLFLDGEAKGLVKRAEFNSDVNKRLKGWYKVHNIKDGNIIEFKDRQSKVWTATDNLREQVKVGDYVKLFGRVRLICNTV